MKLKKKQASTALLAQTPDALSRRVQELGDQMKHLEKDAKVTQKLAPIAKDDFADLEREVKEVILHISASLSFCLSVYMCTYTYVLCFMCCFMRIPCLV